MRIVIASGIYPPDIGGPATYSKLIKGEFEKRGHKVSLVCYSDKKGSDVVRILRKNPTPIRYFLYFWKLLKLAKNADVIYAQGPLAAGLPAMWASKILNKKFVVKIVGDYAWEQAVNQFKIKELIEPFQKKENYNYKIKKIRKIQKNVVQDADRIVVPSLFLKKIVVGWGVDKNKIEVVYNCFSAPKKIKPIKLNDDLIISAGRPEPWKGFDLLKDIMPDLKKDNPRFRLLVANKIPHDELMGYLRAGFAFVLNTGYEGFSHVLLEAMAMGLPVITTNVCGNPEIIKNRENGLLVGYNNKEEIKKAILKLYRDRNLRERLIRNGKRSLEKFNLKEMIDKTLNILKI